MPNILLVGAGGIGCEILKNLVGSGHKKITVVDLDTIDLSNLNRQFLFRKEHINQSKAKIAKEAVSKNRSDLYITAIQDSILNTAIFDLAWWLQFDLVFGALDNVHARKWVNRMCILCNIPLIESGTSGFLGQAIPILRNRTECYECIPKEIPQTFPVCTIRSRPSQLVHCVVWAKELLLVELFGDTETSELKQDDAKDSSVIDTNVSNEEDAKLLATYEEQKTFLSSLARHNATNPHEFAKDVMNTVWITEIENLAKQETAAIRPDSNLITQDKLSNLRDLWPKDSEITKHWTLDELLSIQYTAIKRLAKRAKGQCSFDKDDFEIMTLISSAANVRARLFGIPQDTQFEIKSIAGKIIPAIATTNAIIAGICTLQGTFILTNKINNCKASFLVQGKTKFLNCQNLHTPNPECKICQIPTLIVSANLKKSTLEDLISAIMQMNAFNTNDLSIMSNGNLIYDIDYDQNLKSCLDSVGISSNSFITITNDTKLDDDPSRLLYVFVLEETSKKRTQRCNPLNIENGIIQNELASNELAIIIERNNEVKDHEDDELEKMQNPVKKSRKTF